MMLNFHFHRLKNGTVIVHSHIGNHNHHHTTKQLITLDKYYNSISKVTEGLVLLYFTKNITDTIYNFNNKSILNKITQFIYGHYP